MGHNLAIDYPPAGTLLNYYLHEWLTMLGRVKVASNIRDGLILVLSVSLIPISVVIPDKISIISTRITGC